MYGQKITAPVAGIEPFAKSLGGKFMGLQVSGSAYMPGSLPAHLVAGEGILELNPWIGNEVQNP
jgi:predicted cation transporter